MSSRRGSKASHSRTPAASGARAPQEEHGQDPNQKEQEVDQQERGNQGEVPLPPPPPLGDLEQIIHNQTLILETLTNALINKRPREQTMNDKQTVFLRTKPPTYAPEEVDNDEKKQDMFKKGLNPELRTLLTSRIYPDFNTLINKAISQKGPKLKKGRITSASSWKARPASRTIFRNPEASAILHQDLRLQCSIGPSLR
jgi:hypothetical protein